MQSVPPKKALFDQADYLPVIIHYYQGVISKDNPNPFGHVAIQCGDVYISFGTGAQRPVVYSVTRDRAIEIELARYGNEYAAIRIANPAQEIDFPDFLAKLREDWKSEDYNILTKNCAHAVVYCVDKLGLIDSKSAAVLLKDKGLRPHTVAEIFSKMNVKKNSDERLLILKDEKSNPVKKIELLLENDIARLSFEIVQELASHRAVDVDVKQEKILSLIRLKKKLVYLEIAALKTELEVEAHNQSTGVRRNKTASHIRECLNVLSQLDSKSEAKWVGDYKDLQRAKETSVARRLPYLIERRDLLAKLGEISNPLHNFVIKRLIMQAYKVIFDSLESADQVKLSDAKNEIRHLNELILLDILISKKTKEYSANMDIKDSTSIRVGELINRQRLEIDNVMTALYIKKINLSEALDGSPSTVSLRIINKMMEDLVTFKGSSLKPKVHQADLQKFIFLYFDIQAKIAEKKRQLSSEQLEAIELIQKNMQLTLQYMERNVMNMHDAIYSTDSISPGLLVHIQEIEEILDLKAVKRDNKTLVSVDANHDVKDEDLKIGVPELKARQSQAKFEPLNSLAHIEWLKFEFQNLLFEYKNSGNHAAANFARSMLLELHQCESEYLTKLPQEIFLDFIAKHVKPKWNEFIKKKSLAVKPENDSKKDSEAMQKSNERLGVVVEMLNQKPNEFALERDLGVLLNKIAILERKPDEVPKLVSFNAVTLHSDITNKIAEVLFQQFNSGIKKISRSDPIGAHLQNCIDHLNYFVDCKVYNYVQALSELASQMKIMKLSKLSPLLSDQLNAWLKMLQSPIQMIPMKDEKQGQVLTFAKHGLFGNEIDEKVMSPIRRSVLKGAQLGHSTQVLTFMIDLIENKANVGAWSAVADKSKMLNIGKSAIKVPELISAVYTNISVVEDSKKHDAIFNDIVNLFKLELKANEKKLKSFLDPKEQLKLDPRWTPLNVTESKPSWLLLFYLGIIALKEKRGAYPLNFQNSSLESVWKIGLDYLTINKDQVESLYNIPVPGKSFSLK